jgi:hypothetical protein
MEDPRIRLSMLQCEEIARFLFWKLLYFDEQLKHDIFVLLMCEYYDSELD